MSKEKNICPHCGQALTKWIAALENSWGPHFQLVCFNDECPYFVNGWEWMRKNYNQNVSYRYRYNPQTGEAGPLPVFSKTALRGGIVE
jgi:hypothetical protein